MVEANKKIEKILLGIHSAFDSLVERKKPFDAEAVKNLFQSNMGAQIALLALLTRHIEELEARVGIDVAPTTLSTYVYTHRSLGKFIQNEEILSYSSESDSNIEAITYITLSKLIRKNVLRHLFGFSSCVATFICRFIWFVIG